MRTPTHAPLEALCACTWVTVPELLAARARATPDALYLAKGEARWSFAETEATARRFAGFLQARGYAGRRVASLLPKSPYIVLAWFGSNMLGGPFVALNHAQRGELLADLMVRSRAPVLVTDRASFALLSAEAQAAAELVVFIDEEARLTAGRKVREVMAVRGFDHTTMTYQVDYL